MNQNFSIIEYEELAKEEGNLDTHVIGLTALKNLIHGIEKINANFEAAKAKGIVRPKGIIFNGPPGTGKTLVGKYVAKALKYHYIYASAASLQSPLPGIAVRMIQNLFEAADDLGNCVLFIDEIDAIIKDRSTGGSDSMGALQKFLEILDGIPSDKSTHVLVIVATNHLEHLDRAFTRPGRFDEKIYFTLPGPDERIEFARKIDNSHLDLDTFIEITDGFSYAEMHAFIKNMLFDAWISDGVISNVEMTKAAKTVLYGSNSNTENIDKKTTLFLRPHMAGHTLGYIFMPDIFVLGNVEDNAIINCSPKLRLDRIIGRRELIAQIMSILFAQIAEVKYAHDTSSLSIHDQQQLDCLVDDLLAMFGSNQSGNLNKQKLRVALLNYLAKFASSIVNSPAISNLLDLIYNAYTKTTILTRSDFKQLIAEANITPKDITHLYNHIVALIENKLNLTIFTIKEGKTSTSKTKTQTTNTKALDNVKVVEIQTTTNENITTQPNEQKEQQYESSDKKLDITKDEKQEELKHEKQEDLKDEKQEDLKDEKQNTKKDEKLDKPQDELQEEVKDIKLEAKREEKQSNILKNQRANTLKDKKTNISKDKKTQTLKDKTTYTLKDKTIHNKKIDELRNEKIDEEQNEKVEEQHDKKPDIKLSEVHVNTNVAAA